MARRQHRTAPVRERIRSRSRFGDGQAGGLSYNKVVIPLLDFLQVAAAPDPLDIVRRAARVDDSNFQIARRYTFVQRVEKRRFTLGLSDDPWLWPSSLYDRLTHIDGDTL